MTWINEERRRAFADNMSSQGRSEVSINRTQPHRIETYVKMRELRKFIAEHPGCTKSEMPEHLNGYLSLLLKKKLVTWSGNTRKYRIIEMEEFQAE